MQALLSKARQQDVLALLSPCLLVFAVPLLLPGVAITTVGLLDNPGFPEYGALHVVGMILLAFSIVLIAAGIAVGCALGKRGSHRVKPMEEEEAAHTYNTHAASDKDGLKLGLQNSSDTRPDVQHSSDTRPDVQHSSDTRPDVQHVPHSHPPQGGARPSRHEATSPAVPPPATELAVHDKSGLGQYSVNYCSFQNEVELGQCSADDSSDENEVKLTSCDLTPKDGMSRAPVLLLTSGISSGNFEVPSTSEAQEQLPESSDVAKSAVTSLGSQLPENDDAGGQDGRHHKRRLPRALSMDAPSVRADGERNPGAEEAEDKSRCSHAARDTCDLQSASPHDSSTSASVADTPVQGPPHWRSPVHGLAITRLSVSSHRDEALTSVTAINSSLPAGHRGKASIADTHDSSEAKASWTSRELAVVDVTLSLHLRPGEELAREEEEEEEEVPQTSLSRFQSPSSASGVGKGSQEKMSAPRLWSTSCVLQCDETPADVTEAPLAYLEEEPPRRDANTTLARAHANLDDSDPSIFEEFSGIKTQSSRKHKDWDVSLVSLAQKDMFLSSPAATGPSEQCDRYSSEQVELSNYSPKDQSLSIISLEYPSDLNECGETDSKARVATSPLSSAHLVATSPLSSAHLVAFSLVETLTPQTNHAQRPEQSSQSRETKTAKKKKNKHKKSRKGQGKTVDLKQMPQVADGETPVLSWPLPQTAIL